MIVVECTSGALGRRAGEDATTVDFVEKLAKVFVLTRYLYLFLRYPLSFFICCGCLLLADLSF